jgi:hypothetical protein
VFNRGTPSGRRERFAIMAGVGFDAAVMRDAPVKAHAPGGAHRRRQPDPGRAQTLVIGSVGTLQAGLWLLPDVVRDDGLLDVAVIV